MAHVLSLPLLNADVAVNPRLVSQLIAKFILVSYVPARTNCATYFSFFSSGGSMCYDPQ